MIINGRNLCIGCMELLGDNEVECSHCGLNQRKYNPIPRCLGVGSELKERYVTGKVLGEGAFGITYMGWDKRLNISVAIKEFFPCDMVSRDVICGANNAVYLYESKKKKSYQKLLDKFYYEAQCLSRFNQIDGMRWYNANDRRYQKAKELIQKTERKGGKINMCVLLDMYEERGEARGIEKGIVQGEARGMAKGISQGISQGIEEINTLYHCLLADNRMEDIQKAIMDTEYQKELLREYGIGE